MTETKNINHLNIGCIGVGHMGSVLARVFSEGDGDNKILICDHLDEKVQSLASATCCIASNVNEIIHDCDVIVLGMRPQDQPTFLHEIARVLHKRIEDKEQLLIVTMAAGVACSQVQENLGFEIPVMRIMPNTPTDVGFGAIPYCLKSVCDSEVFIQDDDDNVEKPECALADNALNEGTFFLVKGIVSLLEKSAVVLEVCEENMDAVCALSGSGPAFVYRFIDAMSSAGIALGLKDFTASELALQTVLGSAMLAKQSTQTPSQLADAVCSPGGTTIEGVNVLDASDFDECVKNTLKASFKRSQELSKN